MIQSPEASLTGLIKRVLIFPGVQCTVELWIVMDLIGRTILIHQIEIRICRYLFCKKSNDFRCSRQVVREDEVSDEQSSSSNTMRIESQIANLTVHLSHGGAIYFRIIADF